MLEKFPSSILMSGVYAILVFITDKKKGVPKHPIKNYIIV